MNNREDWWEYTKRIIRSYPALARKAESVGDMPCTPAYGTGGGHGGANSNPVERAVVDRLTDKEQRRYDADCLVNRHGCPPSLWRAVPRRAE